MLIILALINCKTDDRELIYRPVTLTVLDAETKEPLEGIEVTIVNVNFFSKPAFFFIIPIDTTSSYVYHMYMYETDKNGIIEIPQFVYKVDRYHFIDSQEIVLNLEIADKSIDINTQMRYFTLAGSYTEDETVYPFRLKDETNWFFRVKAEYKAGAICCDTSLAEYKLLERAKPYITVISKKYERPEGLRSNDITSFYCDHEAFTFYLERFSEEKDEHSF